MGNGTVSLKILGMFVCYLCASDAVGYSAFSGNNA